MSIFIVFLIVLKKICSFFQKKIELKKLFKFFKRFFFKKSKKNKKSKMRKKRKNNNTEIHILCYIKHDVI